MAIQTQQPAYYHHLGRKGSAGKKILLSSSKSTEINVKDGKDLVLEPSTLQQVHSRRGTILPPLEKSSPVTSLPRPVR